MDFNIQSTVMGHLRMNQTFKICLYQFKTQVAKSGVNSWMTVLDTTQLTASTSKSKMGSNKHISIFTFHQTYNWHDKNMSDAPLLEATWCFTEERETRHWHI